MISEEKKYWLSFSAFPGIGPWRFKLLKDYFGSAKKAWQAKASQLGEIGLGEKLTYRFDQFRKTFSVSYYLDKLKRGGIWFLTLKEESYPKLLKEIADAPFVLYGRGDRGILGEGREPRLAVVGTRRITHYGQEVTRGIVAGLVEAGLTIVSGMAYGVDAVAHEAAIKSGGKTIAVLGCGVDIIHPRVNTKLYWQIVKEAGAVISEFPPGLLVGRGLFPARNRIISGLSLGVVVTEGAADSGALITARCAAEQGREVFAIPGPITSEMSKAPTLLLKQGAKLVTEAKDILEELKIKTVLIRPISQISRIAGLTKEEQKIIEFLQNENLHFDEIVRRSGIAPSKIGTILTMMEMKKYLKNIGGGFYEIER